MGGLPKHFILNQGSKEVLPLHLINKKYHSIYFLHLKKIYIIVLLSYNICTRNVYHLISSFLRHYELPCV